MDNNANADVKAKPRLEGLGGWLILVAIGLILSIVRITYEFFDTFVPLWVNFDDVGRYLSSIADGWYPLIVFETITNIVLFLFTVYVTILFFRKNYKTPKLFIIWDIGGFLFLLSDTLWTYSIFGESTLDQAAVRDIIRQFFHCLIWVPYFLVSVRVKTTFVRGRPAPKKPQNLLVN